MILLLAKLALAAPIDLDAALKLAIRDGVDAQEAAIARRAAESTLARRRLAGLPSFSASASAAADLAGGTGIGSSAGVGLASTTPLYAGGAISADRDAAFASVEAAEADERRVVQDLTLALAGELLALDSAQDRVSAAAAALDAELALERRIAALVAAGARTRADLLQQTAAAAKAKSALVGAQRDRAHAELQLIGDLRLDPRETWEFTAPSPPAAVEGTLDHLADLAVASLPELAAARARLEASEAALRGAGASGRPSLDLVIGASTGVSGAGGAATDQLSNNLGAQATVQLGVPIFDRGVTHDAVTQARLDLDAARLTLAAGEEAAALGIRLALVDRDAAFAAADAADARFAASEEAARVVNDRYEAGAAVLAELLAARADLRDAETARIGARADRVLAEFGLAWAVGAL